MLFTAKANGSGTEDAMMYTQVRPFLSLHLRQCKVAYLFLNDSTRQINLYNVRCSSSACSPPGRVRCLARRLANLAFPNNRPCRE